MITKTTDTPAIQNLHLHAFGDDEGPIIHALSGAFLAHPDIISLDVIRQERVVGNIMFSPLRLTDHPDKSCYLMAPVGVLPAFQGQGVGRDLIEGGVAHLSSMGVEAIFVLGHPGYYASNGFGPTKVLPPHHRLVTRMDAWKMREIIPGAMVEVGGTSMASEPIMDREFWDTSDRAE